MNSIKKLGLVISAIAICLGIFAVTSNAQNSNRRWENRRNNNGSSLYEYQKRQNRRASEWQRRQRQRQQYWQYRSRSRYDRRDNRYDNRGYYRSNNNNRYNGSRRYRRNW